ncbi:acetylglutamate kinase [candidate division KSB1 bacterium]|nr:acetylglutamate kinase [candidate division KSB1 bacterium]
MRRILLKIGGKAFSDKSGFEELATAILSASAEVIILHGGGAEISQALAEARRESTFVDGVRVTQKADMEIIEHVLSERINGRIARYLSEFGVDCLRLAGNSHSLFIARKMLLNGADIGCVGEVVRVNPAVVLQAVAEKKVPVVSPISADEDGLTLNVNADTAAAALAVAAKCTDLVYFSDVPGVMDENDNVVPSLSIKAGSFLIQKGIIVGGMLAKMESIFHAVKQGVQKVHITRWQGQNTLNYLMNDIDIIKTTIQK